MPKKPITPKQPAKSSTNPTDPDTLAKSTANRARGGDAPRARPLARTNDKKPKQAPKKSGSRARA